jgi:hypothetical protein
MKPVPGDVLKHFSAPSLAVPRRHRFGEFEAAEEQPNLVTGFAGEYFTYQVYKFLEKQVPGFTLQNWTSSLRQYAEMPLCEDGLADFQYEGNQMTLLLRSFGLDTNKVLKRVYIEVKSNAGEEKFFFHLSDSQFRNVLLFSMIFF